MWSYFTGTDSLSSKGILLLTLGTGQVEATAPVLTKSVQSSSESADNTRMVLVISLLPEFLNPHLKAYLHMISHSFFAHL